MSDRYDGENFFTVQDGKRMATPLLLALAVIEVSDVVFAVDSVPAVRLFPFSCRHSLPSHTTITIAPAGVDGPTPTPIPTPTSSCQHEPKRPCQSHSRGGFPSQAQDQDHISSDSQQSGCMPPRH